MGFEQNRNAGSAVADLPVQASQARPAFLCVATLFPALLVWGCSGIVSGQNSSPQTYAISGTISPIAGGSGATVTLSGAASATTTASPSGTYAFTGLANGTYAVTPSLAGYTFNPSSQGATVSGANVTGLNFTAIAQGGQTFSISGTITPTAGGSGATVMLSGPVGATTVTNTLGNYTFNALQNGTYTVTPTNTGYSFTPVTQNATINASNVTGVNFTATAQLPHSVTIAWIASTTSTVTGYNVYRSIVSGSSYTLINSVLAPVVTYTDTTAQSATTYYYVTTAVDASGTESIYSNEVSVVVP